MPRVKSSTCESCQLEHKHECLRYQCQPNDFYKMCGYCRAALRKRQCAQKGVNYDDYIDFRDEHHLGGLNPYVVLKAFIWVRGEKMDRAQCETALRELGYTDDQIKRTSLSAAQDIVINNKCAEFTEMANQGQIKDDINSYLVFA